MIKEKYIETAYFIIQDFHQKVQNGSMEPEMLKSMVDRYLRKLLDPRCPKTGKLKGGHKFLRKNAIYKSQDIIDMEAKEIELNKDNSRLDHGPVVLNDIKKSFPSCTLDQFKKLMEGSQIHLITKEQDDDINRRGGHRTSIENRYKDFNIRKVA